MLFVNKKNNVFVIVADSLIMNELAFNFWNRVNELLRIQKKTQVKMCNDLNMSLASLRNKISVQSAPSVFNAYEIAKYLNTTVEYLVSGINSDNTAPDSGEVEKLRDKIKRIETICKE